MVLDLSISAKPRALAASRLSSKRTSDSSGTLINMPQQLWPWPLVMTGDFYGIHQLVGG